MSKYGFIGLGLIGGSLARALKNCDPAGEFCNCRGRNNSEPRVMGLLLR